MIAQIIIPKGFERLRVGTLIRSGDYSLDIREREDGNLAWFKWKLEDYEFFRVKKKHICFIRRS